MQGTSCNAVKLSGLGVSVCALGQLRYEILWLGRGQVISIGSRREWRLK